MAALAEVQNSIIIRWLYARNDTINVKRTKTNKKVYTGVFNKIYNLVTKVERLENVLTQKVSEYVRTYGQPDPTSRLQNRIINRNDAIQPAHDYTMM